MNNKAKPLFPRRRNVFKGPRAFFKGSIAVLNRWTNKPHEHRREKQRNLRRMG